MLNISICDKYEAKLDDIAPSLQVDHYDCSEMTEINFFSLNKVVNLFSLNQAIH